jgi:SAM-dependent methyltransferase
LIKRQNWFLPATRLLFRNEVYSASYYQDVERIERDSVVAVAQWISNSIAPRFVLDVGCGPGHLLAALGGLGIGGFGIDLSTAAIASLKAKGLDGVQYDLTASEGRPPGGPYDLTICCEVAEHLAKAYADQLVRTLTSAAPVVYMTAAEPAEDAGVGLYHVNEQPNSYWIDKMARHGFVLSEDATTAARIFLRSRDVISYLAKPMIFERKEGVSPLG